MKCSIITIHHIHNFGSVFQAYVLFHFLEMNGYETEIIDYIYKAMEIRCEMISV